MSVEKLSYLKAAAALENELRLRRTGKADRNKIAELEAVIRNYSFAELPEKPKPQTPERIAGYVKYEPEQVLAPEVVEIIAELQEQKQAIDLRKNKLANSLFDIPDEVNCRAVVHEIKKLREEWRIIGDQVYFVKKNGHRPSQQIDGLNEGEFLNSLPKDLLDLDRKIKNRKADLSKYRSRLQKAKTEPEKYKQERNIAQAEIELSLMQTQFNSQRK